MADALPEPLEKEQLPIDLRQDLSGSQYTTEQSTIVLPVDSTMHHNFNYTSHHNPSYQQQVDSTVGGHYSTDDYKHTPFLSDSQSCFSNSPSPQSPSPWLHHLVKMEGSVSFPYKSDKGEELNRQYEVTMNPIPEVQKSFFPEITNNDSLISNREYMDVDTSGLSSHGSSDGQLNANATSKSQPSYKTTSSNTANYPTYSPYQQHSNSTSAIQPAPSNLSPVVNSNSHADQNSLVKPAHHSHSIDRSINAREDKARPERLISSDDEQDSLLDPSQGVTSLMDMIHLVQMTKTERSTKTRQVILSKIIQTDDIALLQKFVHHDERIGIRTLGNWLYSYYDKTMMRITLNILKALDKLPTNASDLKNLKIQGVVRLVATMSAGRDDPVEVKMAVTNLDAKWERMHHYQPTKDEAKNLEVALAEARAAMEARTASDNEGTLGHSPSLGNKGGDFADGKADSGKRPYKGGEQDTKPNVKRVKPTVTKESGLTKAKAVTDTDFFNRLLAPKRPQPQEPSKPKVNQSTSDSKASFNANELKKAKTAGRSIPQGKSSDFSLDALLSTIERSPEQKRQSESPPRSPPANKLKFPDQSGSETIGSKRKRGVTFAPDDRIAEYRYYTPNAEEWADQPAGEAISHVHGNAHDLDVGEGRMAFERTHPHQSPADHKDWQSPNPIRLPDSLVVALPQETPESKAQAVREQSTFAAVYTSLAHIPPSPAEPNELPPDYPDANVVHIPLEDLYRYSGNNGSQTHSALDSSPAPMSSLLAATNSVLQSLSAQNQPAPQITPQPVAPPPPPSSASGSVDLNLVGGLLATPGLVQSLLGLMTSGSSSSSSAAAASSPAVPANHAASMPPTSSWQSRGSATAPPPPPPQPTRQSYGYYPTTTSSPPQQYAGASRNQQYGVSSSYPDTSYSNNSQPPTPTARGHYPATGPAPKAPSQRPAINPNFRGAFRGGSRGAPRGGRGKSHRGGRGSKFRGSSKHF